MTCDPKLTQMLETDLSFVCIYFYASLLWPQWEVKLQS